MKEQVKATEYTDELIGKISRLVAKANRIQRERIYTMDYYAGKWLWIRYKEYAGGVFTDIVPRDTRVNEANLTVALAAMRNEIRRIEGW